MTAAKRIKLPEKSPVPAWLENGLLYIVLGLMVLRLTIIEAPLVDNLQSKSVLSSENISLLLSTGVLLCVVLWFFAAVLSGRLVWRKTWLGIGIGGFVLAGVIAACFASNKRAAVTDLVTLATPMLAGVLLVQLLTSAAKIRLALLLILAVGAAATVQCIDQKISSNETMIAEYEANPAEFLQNQGIEPDTLEHWMFEHRIYSEDIRGFLMTSNSAATFFLMAIFAGLGLCLRVIRKKMPQAAIVVLVCYLLGLVAVLIGLFLTQSKGGLGAFGLGVLLLTVLLVFGKAIWKRRRLFGILILLVIVVAAGFVIHYGTQHGRLPGGNSMLVRWQYWVGAVEMIRDHIFTGVGGGNFPDYYTHYKIPAALETVQNPHNWLLLLLSQYGPLGLATIAAAVLIIFAKAFKHSLAGDTDLQESPQQSTGRLWVGMLVFSTVMLLFFRPVLVDMDFLSQKLNIAVWAYFFLYFIPVLVFVLAFFLLRKASVQDDGSDNNARYLSLALVCGLVAVLVHNLIDFAIFEPGNWSLFWLFAAILIAQIYNTKGASEKIHILDSSKRLGLCAGLVVVGVTYLAVVLLPPMRAELLFRRAMASQTQGFELTDQAVAADGLSAKTPLQAGNLLTQVYQGRGMNKQAFLDRAAGFADIAIDRNPADFKPWRLRAKINVIRSEQTEGAVKEDALERALEDLQQAVARYPGKGKLHLLLANVAEQSNRSEVALYHYQTAVEIEDAYRGQFRVMYPERKTVVSRLGNAAYAEAKNKIQMLSDILNSEIDQ